MTYHIYELRDPTTGEVRYVGQSVNPQRREYMHRRICDGKNGICPPGMREWMEDLRTQGHYPVFALVAAAMNSHDALLMERCWIWDNCAKGNRLFNVDSMPTAVEIKRGDSPGLPRVRVRNRTGKPRGFAAVCIAAKRAKESVA